MYKIKCLDFLIYKVKYKDTLPGDIINFTNFEPYNFTT